MTSSPCCVTLLLKTMTRWLLMVALLTCIACGNPNAPSDARLGAAFDLAVGKIAELPDGLRIKFDGVSADSRCPMDALCITAGDATVLVTVFRSGETPVPLELHTTKPASEMTLGTHRIALTALTPYPRASQTILASQYVATFVVTAR